MERWEAAVRTKGDLWCTADPPAALRAHFGGGGVIKWGGDARKGGGGKCELNPKQTQILPVFQQEGK